jgi:predicted Zn-dependent peptidase
MHFSSAAIVYSAFAFLCVLAPATPAIAAEAPAKVNLATEVHVLPNGLTVVLAPDPALPEVGVVVRYRSGAADDPNGLEGLAHITEHLYFGRSRHVPRGAFDHLLESAGASVINGVTTSDDTTYFEVVPPSALGLALWLEADRMASAGETVDDDAVKHERRIVGQEYVSRVIDLGIGAFGQAIDNEIFPAWHPYHGPDDAEGMLFAIGGVGADDVRAFQRTWYSPANAVVALAGPFDPAQVMALVTREFGAIAGAAPPARPGLPGAWSTGDVQLDVRTSLTRDSIVEAWSTPAGRAPGDRELDVAAEILAGPGGTLIQSLVDRGLAVGAAARQSSTGRGSVFVIRAVVADGVNADEVRRGVERAVAALAAHADSESVERARRLLFRRSLARVETALGRARRIAKWDGTGDPWNLDAYADIDREAVSNAVRSILVPANRVTAVLLASKVAMPRGIHAVVERRERRLP